MQPAYVEALSYFAGSSNNRAWYFERLCSTNERMKQHFETLKLRTDLDRYGYPDIALQIIQKSGHYGQHIAQVCKAYKRYLRSALSAPADDSGDLTTDDMRQLVESCHHIDDYSRILDCQMMFARLCVALQTPGNTERVSDHPP